MNIHTIKSNRDKALMLIKGRVASWISRDKNEAKVLEKAQHMLYM